MIVAHHQLRVDKNVCAKDKRNDDTVSELHTFRCGEEGGHEAENDNNPERAKEVWNPGGEVVFGLRGEEGEEDEYGEGEDEGLQDNTRGVEGGNDADGVGLKTRKDSEEDEVGGIALALCMTRPVSDKIHHG